MGTSIGSTAPGPASGQKLAHPIGQQGTAKSHRRRQAQPPAWCGQEASHQRLCVFHAQHDLGATATVGLAAEEAMKGNGMPAWNARVVAEFMSYVANGAYAEGDGGVKKVPGREPTPFSSFVQEHVSAFV